MANYSFSSGKLTFVAKGKPYAVTSDHHNFARVVKALRDGKSDDEVIQTLQRGTAVDSYLESQQTDRVVYKDGTVYIDGVPTHNSMTKRVFDFAKVELPIINLLKFIENLEQNPSFNSRSQLYAFLEHNDIVLTEDGYFLAYKAVRSNYLDKHSGTIDNTPGRIIRMDRSKIDDNPNSACSAGLHVGAIGYVRSFGGYGDKIVIVKVNPRDVVSVPHDASSMKCRVCEYTVLHDMDGTLDTPLYTADGKPFDVRRDKIELDWGTEPDYDEFEDGDVYNYEDEDEYDEEYEEYSDYDEEEDDDFSDLDIPPRI